MLPLAVLVTTALAASVLAAPSFLDPQPDGKALSLVQNAMATVTVTLDSQSDVWRSASLSIVSGSQAVNELIAVVAEDVDLSSTGQQIHTFYVPCVSILNQVYWLRANNKGNPAQPPVYTSKRIAITGPDGIITLIFYPETTIAKRVDCATSNSASGIPSGASLTTSTLVPPLPSGSNSVASASTPSRSSIPATSASAIAPSSSNSPPPPSTSPPNSAASSSCELAARLLTSTALLALWTMM